MSSRVKFVYRVGIQVLAFLAVDLCSEMYCSCWVYDCQPRLSFYNILHTSRLQNEGRQQGSCRATQARRYLHCTRQGGCAVLTQHESRKGSLCREINQSTGKLHGGLTVLYMLMM